ncbi:MAG TPA: methyl-accepting chemotaxis protein [Steroidobacteraceae bacterium]|nr:methyl-accepting chemotaxis protein [Steroidobacteraceae bacterium]
MSSSIMSRDYEIADSEFLVLVSDKASHFLYANAAYLRASGYSWEELKGTVTARMLHKDTPMQVSHDMIKTLRSQQPWSGLIKNRRKDGSAYWLRLNISPLYSQGAFAGSLLVHSKPSRAEIDTHEAMYQRLRADKSLVFSHGRVIGNGLIARSLDRIRNRGLAMRIWASMAALNIGVLLALLTIGGATPLVFGLWTAILVCSTAMGTALAMSIVNPLRDAVRMANRMAAGDLGTENPAARSDEIGALIRALTQMNMNLRATVLDVRGGVGGMQSATSEISNGTQELSGRTEEQASHLEETSTAVGHINTTVQHTAQSAREARQFAKSASVAADTGGQVVGQVITTMDAITQSSRKIAEIIGVIDSIAFQTNILALNAAVEAARAGEHGRGFAVVAGEVRNLAQRTAHSAREIKALISTSVDQVAQGSSLVTTAGKSIEDIVTQVRRVTDLVERIAGATDAQSSGIAEVTQAISKLDHMTQQNASLAQDSTFSAQSLHAQAEGLAQAVGVFKLSQRENLALFNATQKTAAEGTQRSLDMRAA